MAGDPKWTKTLEGLACGGPSAFGYVGLAQYIVIVIQGLMIIFRFNDVPFTPIAPYKEPQSVINEFA